MDKLLTAIAAQFNKVVNWFWSRDPIAQMRLEYDNAVVQIKEGREGLEQYRSLVERVQRQVVLGEKREAELAAKIKAYLSAGNRNVAGQLAVELNTVRQDLGENREQLKMHEQAYTNNVEKIQHAGKKLAQVREKINQYEADLKMSAAEAEIAKLSEAFNFNVTTDFGELEQLIHEKIDLNRAKVRVSADMSNEGLERIQAEKEMEKHMGEDLLTQFEVEMGLKTPETANIALQAKSLGEETAETSTETTKI
ncbi:MAG: hypothetical protein C4523_08095 [Myxococcales bacterium]|nr:MAG: hypothetical protein C4523_08095 [Myxococcales bacterium]